MNILEIVILIIAVSLALAGFRKGFVRSLASMLSLVISITLVSALLPVITEFIKTETPIYGYIVKQCKHVVAEQFVDSYVGQYTAGLKLPAGIQVPELNDYSEELLDAMHLTKVQQNDVIENLPFPERFRSMLLDYNNAEGYKRLNVSTFQEYIVNSIATAILNVISYIVCILLVQLILRVLLTALNVISHLPLIGFVNRVLGLGLGLVEALFVLWIFFLVLSMLTAFPVGLSLFQMVEESRWLSYLYDANLFLKLALGAAAIFM